MSIATPPPPPSLAMMPTQEELDFAVILLHLKESGDRLSPPLHLPRWGAKRKRSVPADISRLPPHPPPRSEKEIRTSSPTSPLSFPASGFDELDSTAARVPSPTVAASIWPSRNAKRPHRELVEEEMERIAVLSAYKNNLEQRAVEARIRLESLRGRNSWLRQLRLRVARAAEEMAANNMNLDRRPMDSPPDAAAAATCRPKPVLDLNASPPAEMEDWRRRRRLVAAHRAAMSKEARRRRYEIKKEKSGTGGRGGDGAATCV